MTTIRMDGLDPAAVLAVLYNHTRPMGYGALRPDANTKMTVPEAQAVLDSAVPPGAALPREGEEQPPELDDDGRIWVSYLRGHSLSLHFAQDEVEIEAYDQSNGPGLADRALAHLRSTGSVIPPS
ncbi:MULTISPECIES: hypothetical protein [Streptomyces]|uniref:hypothetical protein n=1 Tax=Streptomyces TaxID=1883 RepID=UPI00345BDADF